MFKVRFWRSSAAGAIIVTTVSPVTVSPLVPVPEVGRGAIYFLPQELADEAREARQAYIEYKRAARACGMAGVGPSAEVWGLFGVGPSVDSVRAAEYDKQKAAERAKAATEVAIEARLTAARGQPAALELTELARQVAIRDYLRADAKVVEAHRRLADLQDYGRDGNGLSARAMVDNRTFERAANSNVTGVTGIYVPSAFQDLRLTEILARHTEEADGPMIRISGKIVNTRRRAIDVPPLWVAVVDKYGTALKVEQIGAPRGVARIAPGSSTSFSYVIPAVPLRTARAVVTFAPYHRLPQEMPASLYCSGGGDPLQGLRAMNDSQQMRFSLR